MKMKIKATTPCYRFRDASPAGWSIKKIVIIKVCD